jgi:methyl-accepting chemotaxis protein
MKLSVAYLYIIVALKVFLLVLTAISTERFISASNHINLASHIIDTVQQVTITLLNAETGQRGFIITGDERYLEPYLAANISLDAELDVLRRSLDLQQTETNQMGMIATLSHQKMAELDKTVRIRQADGFAAAATIIEKNEGKLAMDHIRDSLAEIGNAQVARSNTLDSQLKNTRFVILSSVAGFFALLIVTVVGIREFFK